MFMEIHKHTHYIKHFNVKDVNNNNFDNASKWMDLKKI